MSTKKILILGGGFGGIRAALELEKAKLSNARIILISDKSHFEYHAALYRLVTGRTPLEVCIPLHDIIDDKQIEIVIDEVTAVNLAARTVIGKFARYQYDYLVLGLGSETSYFSIPGLKELSFDFKSISGALRLKQHFHDILETHHLGKSKEKLPAANFVIIGGGASGVELAGELAVYITDLAASHDFNPELVTIDLVEAAPRLLPNMPEGFSRTVTNRLRYLGVNIFTNRSVLREDVERLYLKDMELQTKTVIWTAGIKPHRLYSEIQGLQFDSRGRVKIAEHLEVPNFQGVFVIGDAAATKYSGMAQTAIYDGRFVAAAISKLIRNEEPLSYNAKKPFYAIPVGPRWAAALIGGVSFYGQLGWIIRRIADLRYFLSILPFRKAINAFRNGKTICESCAICEPINYGRKEILKGGEIR